MKRFTQYLEEWDDPHNRAMGRISPEEASNIGKKAGSRMGGPKAKRPNGSLSIHHDPSIDRYRIKDSTGKHFGGVWRTSIDAQKEADKLSKAK